MATLELDIGVRLRHFELRVGFEVGRETVALVGPSGAGKTTVLRAIAGLTRPGRGRIVLGGRTFFDSERRVNMPPEQRGVGYVFQEYALFPHLTVERNVAFGARTPSEGLLERFGIRHLASARPGELSGGERQRVGLARALARDPGVLLLDEPMSALDAHTRAGVRAELQEILRELDLPTVLVTHDYEDASALADRIGVMVEGRILQLGAPAELVAAPSDSFVASFTGGNLVPGWVQRVANGLTEVALEDGTLVYSTDPAEGRVGVVVYPWEIALGRAAADDSALNHVRGPVASLVPVANRVRVRVGPLVGEVTAASAERLGLREGEPVVASFKAAGTRLVPLAPTLRNGPVSRSE